LTRSKMLLNIMKILILFIALSLLVYFLLFTKTGIKLTHTNLKQWSDYLKSFGVFAIFFGMLAVLIQTMIPFAPFILVAGANVLVFGFWWGFLVNYTMSCVGALLAFIFARYFGRKWVEKRLAKYTLVQKFNNKLDNQGFFYVMIGRLIPVIPSSAINYGSGVSKMSMQQFLFGTVIGKLPIVFMESLIAHDLQHLHRYRLRLILLLAVFVILLLVGNALKKKFMDKPTIK
jgi:uncharacterized membrane protein YdjX (TVP38/TMEM64 family)